MTERVFLGLGSNLGEPDANITRAIERLGKKTGCRHLQISPLYRTPPLGDIQQPDFVNAVVELYTDLKPLPLLNLCKSIEQEMGRIKTERWGPRLIDIDILLYGTQQIEYTELSIPHKGLAQRSFVLFPLADLDAGFEVPGLGSVAQLKAQLGEADIRQLD